MKRIAIAAASFAFALGLVLSGGGNAPDARAAGPCTATCYVNGVTGNDANDGDTPATAKKTMQAGIDAVSAGGAVRVYPGIYNETAAGRTLVSIGGTYQFGLFFPASKPGIKLMGVNGSGNPITNAAGVLATVNTNATNNFGYSGVFVEAANTTIEGLRIGPNTAGDNKTIEVIGDNFTLRYSQTAIPAGGGSVYINDFSPGGTVVKSYHVLDNIFPDGTSVDISSGAGFTGPVNGREILRNAFDLVNNGFNGVSFNGTGGVPWFANPVGGAVINDNSFKNSTQYIRARGVYDNSQFNWKSFWQDNSFDRAAVVLANEPAFDVRTYAYSVFTNVRRIGGTIQGEVDHAVAGDTVRALGGTYTENVIIGTPLTLRGAGDSSKVIPAISGPICGGGSLCPGGSNIILVQADNVTIRDLLLDGNNPALTSGVSSGGVDVDARNGIITNHLLGIWKNLTVDDVTVKNIFLRGIYASSGGTFNFHDNKVTNVQGGPSSIAIFNYAGAGTMANNDVSWANDAISSNHSRGVQMLNNTVTHSQSGLHTDNAGDGGGTPDLIQGNRVSTCQIDSYGIFVFVPYIAPIVKHNTVRGCAVAFSAWGGAFSPSPTVTTIVRDNVFDGKNAPVSVPNSSDGIYVTTDQIGFGDNDTSVAFTNNSVKNFAFGLQVTQKNGKTSTVIVDKSWIAQNGTGLDNEASTLTVTNSCVQKNGDGFVNRALGVTVAHRNNITGNAQFAVNNLVANVLNAENNWWGSSTGPKLVGPNRINSTAAVDAVPFLTSDDDTCQFNADAAGGGGEGETTAPTTTTSATAAATSNHHDGHSGRGDR